MHYVYYLLLLVLLFCGLFINILGLPGLWLMVAAFGGYALLTGWDNYVGWGSLIALIVLGLVAEALEFFAGAAGSSAAGGRKRGAIGAIVGGFLGAIFFSVIPIPIVAQVVGACIGAFIGAAFMEFSDKDLSHSMRVGYGAAKGRFWGIVSKVGVGIVMLIVAAAAALPVGVNVSVQLTPPTTASTTAPATNPTVDPTTAP